jgi:predicted hydrocarbon binding protein
VKAGRIHTPDDFNLIEKRGFMPFKAERFIMHFKEITGMDCIYVNVDEYHNQKVPFKKASYLNKVMMNIEDKIGSNQLRMIMEKCGMECIGKSVLEKAKNIYKKNSSIDTFIDELNKNHIGGGYLKLNGNIIEAVYDKCYCGSVSKTRQTVSINYCYCSTGWYKRLFEEIFDKEVKVEIMQSIINGADSCKFNIYL